MEIGLIMLFVGLNLFVTSVVIGMLLILVIKVAWPWLMLLLSFLIIIIYISVVFWGCRICLVCNRFHERCYFGISCIYFAWFCVGLFFGSLHILGKVWVDIGLVIMSSSIVTGKQIGRAHV